MSGLTRLCSARVICAGHTSVQNLRRGHHELNLDVNLNHRLPAAFAEPASPHRPLALPYLATTMIPAVDQSELSAGHPWHLQTPQGSVRTGGKDHQSQSGNEARLTLVNDQGWWYAWFVYGGFPRSSYGRDYVVCGEQQIWWPCGGEPTFIWLGTSDFADFGYWLAADACQQSRQRSAVHLLASTETATTRTLHSRGEPRGLLRNLDKLFEILLVGGKASVTRHLTDDRVRLDCSSPRRSVRSLRQRRLSVGFRLQCRHIFPEYASFGTHASPIHLAEERSTTRTPELICVSPTPSTEISDLLDAALFNFLARFRIMPTERAIMPQKKSAHVPVPDEVGLLYDRFVLIGDTKLGDNLHVGYWDNPDSDVTFDEATDRLTDIMTEKLRIGAGSHVLDVGCGAGGPGVRIAQLTGARVTGISVSREQVRLANSLAESVGLTKRVMFQWADVMEMPFSAQSFDAAIALESMGHMPHRGQALAQICRSLRPGGRLVLTDLFERAPIPAAKQPTMDRFYNELMSTMVQAEDYPPLLRHAGLWFEEILDIGEQTLPKSFMWLSAKSSQAQPKLEAMFGDEVADRLHFDWADLIDIAELGYLMIVAKRPDK